jgi:hypothetical protein
VESEDFMLILQPEMNCFMTKEETLHFENMSIYNGIGEKLTDILSAHFSNGFRLNSLIETARFRAFAAEKSIDVSTLTDYELQSSIESCGTTCEGKVYVISNEAIEHIKELIDKYFSDGSKAIFYTAFYSKNEKWLCEASIVSEKMLVGILRRMYPRLLFTKTCFGYSDASILEVVDSEIRRVWGDDVLLSVGQLAERLQYVPSERLKFAIGRSGDFIWNSPETYTHVGHIVISDDERAAVNEAAMRECNARSYVSITDLPLGDIAERNWELSVAAVHNAVYRACLSDRFDKRGKIITRRGDVFDAMTVMKNYCRNVDKCSLDDLLTFEKRLTGEIHRWIPMEAGNTVMVRIDKDNYVADRYVRFNAKLIDEAMEPVVKGDYTPLKAFTTFGAFPDCGQAWNLFLLESYCRRFSRVFQFGTPSVNSRNAGAVIRKSCSMNYTEVMADAVAKADIHLNEADVSSFLYNSGYTGRRATAKSPEIIEKAKAIRERRSA